MPPLGNTLAFLLGSVLFIVIPGPTTQMLALGLLFVLLASGLDSLWAVAAGTARSRIAKSPQQLSTFRGAGGLMMIVMGVGLAVSGRRD